MRTTFLILLAATALNAQAQPARWQVPQTEQENRELPRTQTISYDSEQGSLLRSHTPSTYLQPLDGDWAVQPKGQGTSFTHHYKMPFKWIDRELLLHIGGVNTAYEVYANGRYVGYNQDGRTAAEFDLTHFSEEGNNTLEIVTYPEAVSRKLEDHTTGEISPALTDKVYITAQPRMRIRDYVSQVEFEGTTANLELGVIFKSHLLNTKTIKMYYQLLSPTGQQVGYGHRDVEVSMRREDTVRFFIPVPDARPWSHETPNLYTLLLKTQYEGRFMEYVSYKIGLRTVGMQNGKLLINGREVPLMVLEYNGGSDSATLYRELKALQEKGVNTLKVKNFPQSERFYETCDRLGLYVCNQANVDTHLSGDSRRKGGNPSNDPIWEKAYIDRALGMYHTSRNHPSVIMFSLAENSANGYNLYESYLALKAREQKRPVAYLGAKGEWNTDAVTGDLRRNNARAAAARMTFGLTPLDNIRPVELFDITAVEGRQDAFRIHNKYLLTPLHSAEVVYTVRVGKRTVSEGRIPVDIAAQESVEVTVPFGKAKPGSNPVVELAIECIAPGPYDYIPASAPEQETERGVKALLNKVRPQEEAPQMIELFRKSLSTQY